MQKYLAHHLIHIPEHRKKVRALAAADTTLKVRPIPTKPEEMTWRDYLIMLLHIGSELEHGLMVQYLYAAYSLGGDHLSQEDQKEVQEWQDLILTVAREEMGHLLTVQNLLCLVGGPISFDRENYPWDSPFYPFQFNFEPLTRKSLDTYVFAEMPSNFDALQELHDRARKGSNVVHFGREVIPFMVGGEVIPFMESTVKEWVEKEGHPVGEVYQAIHDILADPGLIPDSDFRPETYRLQASWDDWGRGYRPSPDSPSGDSPRVDNKKATLIVERVATRTDALYAVSEIAGQGENPELRPRKGEEPSHFMRFKKIMHQFDQKLKTAKDWSPARRIPINPTTPATIDPENPPPGRTVIACPASAKWAELFNCRYRMLLTFLTHTFRLARIVDPNVPNTRGAIMHRIFGEMYNLKAISGILVRMPLTPDPDDPRRAGPPFEMPYSLVLPPDEIDCWRLHRDIIVRSKALCDSLLDSATDFLAATPPEGRAFVQTLRNSDANAINWVDTVLGGLRENGASRS